MRFPSICMICKKKSIKINNKCQPLTNVIKKKAEMKLKAAAQARDDKDMIASVHETDLIAKEFQKHEKMSQRIYQNSLRKCTPIQK